MSRYSEEDLIDLEENAKNGAGWFNAFQEVDSFVIDLCFEKGIEFDTTSERPESNLISAIKRLSK